MWISVENTALPLAGCQSDRKIRLPLRILPQQYRITAHRAAGRNLPYLTKRHRPRTLRLLTISLATAFTLRQPKESCSKRRTIANTSLRSTLSPPNVALSPLNAIPLAAQADSRQADNHSIILTRPLPINTLANNLPPAAKTKPRPKSRHYSNQAPYPPTSSPLATTTPYASGSSLKERKAQRQDEFSQPGRRRLLFTVHEIPAEPQRISASRTILPSPSAAQRRCRAGSVVASSAGRV